MNTKRSTTAVGFLLFFAGVFLGTAFFGGLTWAQFEATFYGFPRLSTENFDGLTCPKLMTISDTGTLHATVKNETDRKIEPVLRVEISTPAMARSERIKLSMEPGESKTATWSVSSENIDLDFFIFAKVYRYPAYKTPLAEAGCGILVLDLPFISGQILFGAWLGASILLTLSGLWLLTEYRKTEVGRARISGAMTLLAVVVLIGLVLGIQGIWLLGILALMLVVLLTIVILYLAVNRA